MTDVYEISNESARDLLELSVGDSTTNWEDFDHNLKLVYSELVDNSRWSLIYARVYEDLNTGRFWGTSYSVGATECQDETPYEYDGDVVAFFEVFKKEKTVVFYE